MNRAATARPMRLDRLMSGRDALPMGQLRPVHTYEGGTAIDCTPGGTSYASEVYRMRTLPHLYDERDIEEMSSIRAGRLGALVDRDCHTCRHAIVTRSVDDSCTLCGSRRMTAPY